MIAILSAMFENTLIEYTGKWTNNKSLSFYAQSAFLSHARVQHAIQEVSDLHEMEVKEIHSITATEQV